MFTDLLSPSSSSLSVPRTRPYKRRFRASTPRTSALRNLTDFLQQEYREISTRLSSLPFESATITNNYPNTTNITLIPSSTFNPWTTDSTPKNSTNLCNVQNITMPYQTASHSIAKILHSILFFILQQEGNIWKYAFYFTLFCFSSIAIQIIIRRLSACRRTYFPVRKHHPQLQIQTSSSQNFTEPSNTRMQNNANNIRKNNRNKLSLAPNQISLGGSVITFFPDEI